MAHIISFQGIVPRIDPTAFVAPTAVLIGNVEIGPDASIWFGAVLRGDNPDQVIRVGARTSIQDNCVLHISERGPTIVGDDVTVGHGAVFESCRIERGALIGMNAVLLHEAVIGESAIVAASSLVPERMQVPPRTLVAGVPAQVRKELSEEALRALAGSAEHYVRLKDAYQREWIGTRG
jgi:carbonic anhydrase/acetyltransferase-like protein (isoleucine patch superfamily)